MKNLYTFFYVETPVWLWYLQQRSERPSKILHHKQNCDRWLNPQGSREIDLPISLLDTSAYFLLCFQSPDYPFMSIFMMHQRERQVESSLLPSSDINTWVAHAELLKMPHFTFLRGCLPDMMWHLLLRPLIYMDMMYGRLKDWLMVILNSREFLKIAILLSKTINK